MSAFNRRHVLPALKQALGGLAADLVFLQEVQGEHRQRASLHADWPTAPQHAFLADDALHHAYGRNADYREGHHGNAVLSRFPILGWHNQDISLNTLERRGLLHAELDIAGWSQPLHALCVHLNLRSADRRRQLAALAEYVHAEVPSDAPLIVAGDFNDWQQHACGLLQDSLGLREAFHSVHGRLAASFPARLPLLTLDRIYLRGFAVLQAEVHTQAAWQGLSDHAPLSATIKRL
ncbi:EEP domain-containing protein [Chitinimonas arctica]|uniref:EEP domain-containing protein n=2 Tax=Chitinimonas arctica TaxID=2594795 RepID=A0A516SJ06_9NEIS|nr:EEP domain-containing protein [Chitinimonas arctica]